MTLQPAMHILKWPKRKPLDILAILSYRRPHGSKSEKKFISKFIKPLGVHVDTYGNLVKVVGAQAPKIMWSCHTDTVHRIPGRQRIVLSGGHQLKVSETEPSRECLGADDGAGVYLLREMILSKVPGLYVFHRNEERGCLGAKALLAENPKLFDGLKFAVAFDRRGTNSIITHQRGRRMCSLEFAESLNDLLGGGFKDDPTGTFTDTATYADIIPECTNVSVGYEGAHGSYETLNVEHLFKLRVHLCAITQDGIDKLVAKRDPSVTEYRDYSFGGWRHDHRYPNGSIREDWREDEWGCILNTEQPVVRRWGHASAPTSKTMPPREVEVDLKEYNSYHKLKKLVEEYPDTIASYLEDMGIQGADVAQYILDTFGAGALDE